MKKIFSIAFIFFAYMAYAQNNIEEYGLGASESDGIINTKQAPTNPVFNKDHYKILKSADYVAVKMDNEQFCKDVTVIRAKDQSPTMAFNKDEYYKAGPLFITTDRILEERLYYSYSNELLKHYNMDKDNRGETYLETDGSSEANMRGSYFKHHYYYDTAYSIYQGTVLVNIFDDFIPSQEIKIARQQYAIPDSTSASQYKEINYELIAYFTNRPGTSKTNDVSYYNMSGKFAGSGDDATANILGCYAVQKNYGGDIDYNKDYDFYWLVSYQFKGKNYSVRLKNRVEMNQKLDVMYKQNNSVDLQYDWRNIIDTNY